MADGTISMAEGLGCKALDSNEIRRKQKNSADPNFSLHLQQTRSVNPNSGFGTGDLNLGPTLGGSVPPSCPAEFGEFSPKSAKCSSPSRKLQQVFEQELIREAEERATWPQSNRGQENKNRVPPGPLNSHSSEVESKGSVPPSSSGTALLHSNANQQRTPSEVTHLHGNTYQFQRTPSEVIGQGGYSFMLLLDLNEINMLQQEAPSRRLDPHSKGAVVRNEVAGAMLQPSPISNLNFKYSQS